MRVSLIIATRDRADSLGATLAAVSRIEDPDWEVIVVDNGSRDHTTVVLSQFDREGRIPLRLVTEPVEGLGRARNQGVAAASGEVLAFTDDDCYPGPDHLARLRAWFQDAGLGFVGGAVVLHDPADLPIKTLTHGELRRITPGSYLPAGRIIGANMALRRSALERIGGFDPLLTTATVPSGEDLDALGRLAADGWTGVYDPALVVRHHHRIRRSEDIPRIARAYDLGRGAYMLKLMRNPNLRRSMMAHWWRGTRLIADRDRIRNEVEGALRYLFARWTA
jgi:glycosyltransferase involved in cell wall biosynthesis